MPDNPFDQLGLKKELLTFLHGCGQLDDYLKGYVRLTQLKVHPDRAGPNELSSLVNSAYATIQENKSRVPEWLSTMQNGHNEYKDMLEALVPEMERQQQEIEELRTQLSASLAQKAGSVDAKVRTAPTSTSTPKPSVRTPPHVDPDVRTPPRATATPPRTATPTPDSLIAGRYILMPRTSTYARGIEALRTISKTPLTFKENILARVEAYESSDHRLFDTWLDSCTGIVYKAGTTKFKIVPNCTELRGISADFSQHFIPVNYAKIEGIELDSGSSLFVKSVKYNGLLTKAEIVSHPAWLTAMDGDKHLLKTYTDIVFSAYAAKYSASDKLMGFWVRDNTKTDEGRALFVIDLGNGSNADGGSLYYDGSFLASR